LKEQFQKSERRIVLCVDTITGAGGTIHAKYRKPPVPTLVTGGAGTAGAAAAAAAAAEGGSVTGTGTSTGTGAASTEDAANTGNGNDNKNEEEKEEEKKEEDDSPDRILDGEVNRYILSEEEQKKR
jgi:hypothetical protein